MITIGQLLAQVDKTSTCWLWTGSRNPQGYGRVYIQRKTRGVHRLMYELLVGPIPNGLQIDHLCRVHHCVNPAHMEPVTQRENILRGEGSPARRARQTHCKHGHELTPENIVPTGPTRRGRRCRACARQDSARYRAKTSAADGPPSAADTQSGRGRAEQSSGNGEGRQDSATTPRPGNPEDGGIS